MQIVILVFIHGLENNVAKCDIFTCNEKCTPQKAVEYMKEVPSRQLNLYLKNMKEFDYELDYKNIDFTVEENRKLYRIGRGEQGVLLVQLYTNDICRHWRFVNESVARKSADKIYSMFCDYKEQRDFIGMDMARKFLEMGFTRSRRYANHPSGKKYARDGSVSPQSPTALHCEKSRSANVFKRMRDKAAYDEKYVIMRKEWRASE